MQIAAHVAREVADAVVISSDVTIAEQQDAVRAAARMRYLQRPADLARDDASMLDVVQHALEAYPGKPDDIWLLVQPTAPLRTPAHLREAVRLLRQTREAESVVSVVRIPATHHPANVLAIREGPALENVIDDYSETVFPSAVLSFPDRRQDTELVYIRDGTVYAFYRATVEKRGSIYGNYAVPLVIDPADSCELDDEVQWAEVERRWKERHG